MNRPSQSMWPLVLLIGALAAFFAHEGRANRAMQMSPTVVATVDLEKVFDQLNLRADADRELETLRGELTREVEKRRGEIDVLRGDLELHPKGSAEHLRVSREVADKAFGLKAMIEYTEVKRNLSHARMLRRIYFDVRKAVADLSEREGYDLVILDDTKVELPDPDGADRNPLLQRDPETEVTRQISARRLLYATPRMDITDEVIRFMNG